MLRFKTRDGLHLEGETAEDVAESLRKSSFNPNETLAHYMRQTAEGAEMQTGHKVRADTAENFLTDLVAAGLMIPIE